MRLRAFARHWSTFAMLTGTRVRLHRITLWVADANTGARRVYEKVGFVEEGRARESFRRDGKWHDMILMGLLEGELQEP